MSDVIIECRQLSKTFQDGKLHVNVLRNIHLQIKKQEQVAIVGSSGAGKSTLLHLLGGLDEPTCGEVYIAGKNIHALNEKARSRLRNQTLGFVYQFHHLLPEFTLLENVCMPLLIRGIGPKNAAEKALILLEKAGLSHRLRHKLGELSGGERQRTAIVRALMTDPLCILADEPTGNLDNRTAAQVYEMMLALNRDLGTSILIVTHDRLLAQRMDRILHLENGMFVEPTLRT